ncbi:MAG TPA: PCYCGC motif-containing (lipo)protein [Gemmatimonadaceae bacterium]|nr:PCYCGC motif-containing (lipo)protein [Gemmatimonadaceae bacterium]
MITRRRFLLLLPALIASQSMGRNVLAQRPRIRPAGFPHPEPRAGVTAELVLPESDLPDRRRVREAYAAARTHPELFDGVYCACRCDKSMEHRSLLSCFESRQPIGCMACRDEAEVVARLARDGRTLEEIRRAVDEEFAD